MFSACPFTTIALHPFSINVSKTIVVWKIHHSIFFEMPAGGFSFFYPFFAPRKYSHPRSATNNINRPPGLFDGKKFLRLPLWRYFRSDLPNEVPISAH
jgi:hypothetical protein